jgi:hypothetical protein
LILVVAVRESVAISLYASAKLMGGCLSRAKSLDEAISEASRAFNLGFRVQAFGLQDCLGKFAPADVLALCDSQPIHFGDAAKPQWVQSHSRSVISSFSSDFMPLPVFPVRSKYER